VQGNEDFDIFGAGIDIGNRLSAQGSGYVRQALHLAIQTREELNAARFENLAEGIGCVCHDWFSLGMGLQ